MKLTRLGAVLAASAMLLSSPLFADPVEMRLATGTPPSHVWSQAAFRFAEEVASASDGEITIAVFPASQLGPENDQLQQLQVGVLDMAIISAAAASSRAPAFLAWFSPFAMPDVEATIAASKTEVAGKILDELNPLGIKGMGYVFAGMRHILMAKDPVTSLADLEGKKIRITPFPGMQVWWQAAGAVPTPVQLADVYQSLNSGLLDGVDIDLDALVGFSMQQVADHLIATNHMAFPGVAMITQGAWDRMDAGQQEIFTRVMGESLDWAAAKQIATEAANMALLEGEMTVTHPENAKAMFASANDAFNAAFSDIALVAEFQAQIAN